MTGTNLKLLCHIPGVSLAQGATVPYAGGILMTLPYESWVELDPEMGEKRRQSYELVAPAFYVGEVGGAEANVDEAFVIFRGRAEELHIALTLSTAAALPGPEHSVAYIQTLQGTERRLGRFEREAVVRGPVLLIIDSTVVEETNPILDLVNRSRASFNLGEICQAVSSLSATALPGFEAIDGIVQCGIALEALLLADVTAGVTSVFIQRGAALLANGPEEVGTLRAKLSTVYGLRSDALHGRDWTTSGQAHHGMDERAWYCWLRRALARAVCRVLHATALSVDPVEALARLRIQLDSTRAEGTVPSFLVDAPGPALT